jgi:hypothetical protein
VAGRVGYPRVAGLLPPLHPMLTHCSEALGRIALDNPKTFTTAPDNRDDNGMGRGQLLYHLIIFIE